MTQLTKNFTLEEFTDSQTAARRGIDNTPTAAERVHLLRLAETLEKVRSVLGGHPILISSGYRNAWLNAAVGGSKSSKHMQGLAVDFTCPGHGSPLEVCLYLKGIMEELVIDQLIHEFDQWVHLGLSLSKARHQCLTIDKNGTRSGF